MPAGQSQVSATIDTKYAASGLGLRSSGTDKAPTVVTSISPQGRVSGKELRIGRWLGLMTRPARGQAPLGALADMKNLLVNKKDGALVLRTGASAYALPAADVSGDFVPTTGSHVFKGEFTVEVPSSVNQKISVASDGSNLGILQTNFFPNSSSVNSGAVKWGESLAESLATGAAGSNTMTFVGGEDVVNYYKYWLIQYESSKWGYITASSYSGGTTTLTLLEDITTGFNPVATPEVTLYRHFHDNLGFAPTYTSGAIALQQGQAILFSGGQSSSVGCKPIWSGYLSKTLFTGASVTLPFAGTYVTEAEIKSTNGFSGGTVAAYSATPALNENYRWFVAHVLETDDGQRSQLIHPATRYADVAAGQGVQTTVAFNSQINKRFRYMHTLLGYSIDGSATSIDWSQYFLVKTTDLTASGFTYVESTTVPGTWTLQISLTDTQWQARAEDAVTFLGHTEADNTTVSFSKAVYVNNRLFVARYYDYTATSNYDDQIRYSVFASNGVAQLNVLANVSEATESQVEPGDPAVIRGLARYEDKLFIVKDESCYYVSVNGDPTMDWSLVTIARIGSDVDASVVTTPFGIVFAKTGEDIYLWDGGYPRPLLRHYRATYAALTPASAWYEWETKTYNIFVTVSTETTWLSMSFDALVDGEYVWVKHNSQTIVSPAFSAYDPGFYPVFTAIDDTTRITFRRISTSTTDVLVSGGTSGIIPYFKTAPIVLDERHIVKCKEWHLAVESPTSGSGTLTVKLTTSGAVGSAAQTYSNISKTETLHIRKVNPITGRGRQVEFEYNTAGATNTAVQFNEFGITYDIVPTQGDSVKTS